MVKKRLNQHHHEAVSLYKQQHHPHRNPNPNQSAMMRKVKNDTHLRGIMKVHMMMVSANRLRFSHFEMRNAIFMGKLLSIETCAYIDFKVIGFRTIFFYLK